MAGQGQTPSELNEVSRLLCRQLDSAGYSQDMIHIRQNKYKMTSKLIHEGEYSSTYYGGSKGEGLSKLYEGDDDVLFFLKHVICVNNRSLIDFIPFHKIVFRIRNVHPGYCILEDVSRNKWHDSGFKQWLVGFRGRTVLSSSLFRKYAPYKHRGLTATINGPAHTFTLDYGMGYQDIVHTLPCECSKLMDQFIQRQRHHDWPPSTVLHYIQNKCESSNLVATGKAGSDTEDIEWRYCFNTIELLLVKSLNETQTKLYIVLKMVNNDILKKYGFTLTSFIMKNIVFWLAESNPQDAFQSDTLFMWVTEGLKMLQNAVEQNELKYFMIPGRNLFTEKVKEADRERLKKTLADLIKEGPGLLLHCQTIAKRMSLTTEELKTLQRKLEELELCMLYHGDIYCRIKKTDDLETIIRKFQLGSHREKILASGWPTSIQRQIDQCDIREAIKMLLS